MLFSFNIHETRGGKMRCFYCNKTATKYFYIDFGVYKGHPYCKKCFEKLAKKFKEANIQIRIRLNRKEKGE
jgi:hypothetical protein